MQKQYFMIVLILLVGVTALTGAAYFAGRVYNGADVEVREAVRLKEAEIDLKTAEAELIETKVKATARLAAIRQRARIAAAKPVEDSAILLAVYWHILPPALTLFAVAGGGLALALRRYPFTAGGVTAFVTRREAAILAERAIYVQGLTEEARIAAFQEQIGRERFQQGVSLFSALGRAWKNGSPLQTALPDSTSAPAPRPVPNFAELLHRKVFQSGKVLIGYDAASQPVYMAVTDFVSCGFGGGSGSGKTTKLRFLIGQLAWQGVRLHILDAHSGDPESLVSSLGQIAHLPNVTTYPALESHDTIDLFLREVTQAIDRKEPAKAPVIYVIDELLPILDAVPATEKLIIKLATEGRKFQRFGVFSSQVWPAALFKGVGSAARDALMLKMAAKMPIEQARILFKSKEKAQTVERLELPEMFASSMKWQGVVTVPFCTQADMDTLARAAALPSTAHDVGAGATQQEPADEPAEPPVKPSEPPQFDCNAVRAATGLSQREFADATGISLSKLKKVEVGSAAFTPAEIAQILHAFEPRTDAQ